MDRFTALADPTRRRIVEMLSRRAMAAGEITAQFDMSAPAISQHLKMLKEAGLVRVEIAGQRRIYRLDPDGLDAFESWVRQVRGFWNTGLDRLELELTKPDDERGELS